MDTAVLDTQIAGMEAAFGQARSTALQVEIGRCDTDRLAAIKQAVTRLANVLDAVNADIAARAAELRLGGNTKPVDDAVNPGGRQSPHVEKGDKDRADVFGALPGLEDATKSGELSGRYADIVAKALKNLNSEVRAEFVRRHQDLGEIAAQMSEHRFRLHVSLLVEQVLHTCGVDRPQRQRRNRRASTWTDLETGMWCLRGSWDADTGAELSAVLQTEVNAIYRARRDDPTDLRTRDQILADALSNLICGTPAHDTTRRGATTVLVITDQATLDDGPHDAAVHEYGSGTPAAPSTVQRLTDDPDVAVIPVIVNEHGVVEALGDADLDLGRSQRLASQAQRWALRVMHRTCLIAGCDEPFDACEIHHLIEWEHGGATNLVNLGPLCSRHHHQLHREGWKLRLDPDTRTLTITLPDGTVETHPFTGLAPPGTRPPGNRDTSPESDEPGDPDSGHAA